jgi:hypothetical protein
MAKFVVKLLKTTHRRCRMKDVLIVDIGYGDTKYLYLDEEGSVRKGKIPTAVVRLGKEKIEGKFDALATISKELVYNGTRYVVGEEALKEGIPLSTRRKDFIPTYAPLIIAKIFQRENLKGKSKVVVSVAISDYTREHKEKIVQNLSRFMVNGNLFEFDVAVLPQGCGIYWDVFPEGNEGTVVVADIGFNTIDISVFENGRPIKEKLRGLPGYGTNRIIQNLAEKVSEEVGEPVSELEINRAVQSGGKLKVYNREIPIADWFEEEKEVYAEEIIAMIETGPVGKLWRHAEARIIAGGGGYFIPEQIRKEKDVIVPEEPEFSNVRGFFNYFERGEK